MKMKTQSYAVVKKAIDALDPIGLLAIGTPEDEYDPEIKEVLARLWGGQSESDVQELLHGIFVDMFDKDMAGRPDKYQKPAHEIYAAIISKRS